MMKPIRGSQILHSIMVSSDETRADDTIVAINETIPYHEAGMMNGRQKIEAAFSREGTPEIPAVICYEDIFYRDHWDNLTTLPWWYAHSPDIEQQITWMRDVIPKVGQDWMVLPSCPARQYRESHNIIFRDDGVYLIDRFKDQIVEIKPPTVGGWEIFKKGYSGHVPYLAQTRHEVSRAIPKPPPFNKKSYVDEGRADLARLQLAEFGNEHYPIGYISTPLWNCFFLWGFEGMMTMIAEQPGLVKEACNRFLPAELNGVHEAAAHGAAGIWIEDSLTDLISPQAFETLNLPYLQKLVAEIHTLGMHSIYYFCGNPAGKLNIMLDSGTDALALEESKKGFVIDLAEVVEVTQGRCVLFGNLDAIHLLPNADEITLRNEIRRQIKIGRKNKNRFVMSLGSPVTPCTTPARVRYYCDLVHEEGSI